MINKKEFIDRYIKIIKDLLNSELPEKDGFMEMCEKADRLIYTKTKRGSICS
jgi:hypothetical protein